MNWTCLKCKHTGLLTSFYKETSDDDWDYVCPHCGTVDNRYLRLPRLETSLGMRYVPSPKQVAMHISPVRNVLWGGRAGTGKSWALRHDGYMRCLSRPNYRALLLRRQTTELQGTHLDKCAYEERLLEAEWKISVKRMYFSNGSIFRFGHCENDADVGQYLSEEFDIIYYDEGSTFTEYQIRFINSRLRSSKKSGITPLVRIGSNPGAMFLYEYFIEKRIDAERDPSYDPKDYEFIPATITDNPHVNVQEQEMRLNSLPSEALRKMYRDGDWLAVEGQEFSEWQPKHYETGEPWHVLQELPEIDGKPITHVSWIKFVRAIDWGYDPDEGVCTWFAMMPNRRYIAVKEMTFKRLIAKHAAEKIAEESRGMTIMYSIGGTDMWMKSGQTGESIAETFARNKVAMQQANQDRINGWQRVHALLTDVVDDGHGPVPMLQVYEPGCPQLARTIPMMQGDPKNPGDILQRKDHWIDTLRTFAMSRPSTSHKPKDDAWARLPKEVRARILKTSRSNVLGSESVRRSA